jgi:DNA repair protein RecO (recombination protein O)
MRQRRERRDDEPAFILHTHPYRETSLIVEAFTERHGRVAMVAKGAKRPRSEMRGVLQAFQPLLLSWAGANELLLKLLAREDAHPMLWHEYASALRSLTEDSAPASQAATLRRFELRLLAELGYALTLTHDVASGRPVAAGERYHYVFDRGPQHVAAEPRASWPVVRGATLIALASERYTDADVAAEAKRLMRGVLDHYLEARRIFSRRVVQDLAALEDDERK